MSDDVIKPYQNITASVTHILVQWFQWWLACSQLTSYIHTVIQYSSN